MPRVLISFLGTGVVINNTINNEIPLSSRKYSSANYQFSGNDRLYSGKFVASVISERYNTNKVFMLGTVHSMWEEVFSTYANRQTANNDDNARRNEIVNNFNSFMDRIDHLTNDDYGMMLTSPLDKIREKLSSIVFNSELTGSYVQIYEEAYPEIFEEAHNEFNPDLDGIDEQTRCKLEKDLARRVTELLSERLNPQIINDVFTVSQNFARNANLLSNYYDIYFGQYQNANGPEEKNSIKKAFVRYICYDINLAYEYKERFDNAPDENGRFSIAQEFFEKIYKTIGSFCEISTHDTAVCIPHKVMIETALGRGSRVILIKYGINDTEIKEIINTIMSLEKYIGPQDEVIVDITHSFRSLPVFIMNLLLYLQTARDLNITHIHYGMLEIRREMGFIAPIVDLKGILDINKWISGAASFKQYGNAYKLAELIRAQGFNHEDLANRLKQFSDILNLNHLNAINNLLDLLAGANNWPEMAKIIALPIFNDFLNRFANITSQSARQYQLAQWQYDHMNYSAAYNSFTESIITFVCEKLGFDIDVEAQRLLARDILLRGDNQNENIRLLENSIGGTANRRQLAGIYNRTRRFRNALAHSLAINVNPADMINTLKNELPRLRDMYVN